MRDRLRVQSLTRPFSFRREKPRARPAGRRTRSTKPLVIIAWQSGEVCGDPGRAVKRVRASGSRFQERAHDGASRGRGRPDLSRSSWPCQKLSVRVSYRPIKFRPVQAKRVRLSNGFKDWDCHRFFFSSVKEGGRQNRGAVLSRGNRRTGNEANGLGLGLRPPPLVLRNGSARDRPLPQVLEAQQHGQRPFKFAVEMDLVAAEPLQLVGVERLAKRLLADQRTVGELLLAVPQPGQHFSL